MRDDTKNISIEKKLKEIEEAAVSLRLNVERLTQVANNLPASAIPAIAASGRSLTLTPSQRRICERVINVFETGSTAGNYGAISIYRDGPGQIRQITYGRSQTTEYGNLRELVRMYVDANGTFSADLRPFVSQIGSTPLVDNASFKNLLKRAGNEDAIMRTTQDAFFERRYFQPAVAWAGDHGFTEALSALVIYDSFIHSGGILGFLRDRFPERPPADGGDERTWIRQYIDVRHSWLTNHSNPDVRPSNYRTRDLKREIAAGNWQLAALPFIANGVPVDDGERQGTTHFASAPSILSGTEIFDEEIWSELEPPTHLAYAARATTAELAATILGNSRIKLAISHSSGNSDPPHARADARQNIVDTAAGSAANRSSYGSAPGGQVMLDAELLAGMLRIAETYSYHVTELCGGEHSSNSRHYAGVAFDVNEINGRHVSASHPDQAAFRALCANLGATEIRGPGNTGHSTHIHAAWPRP